MLVSALPAHAKSVHRSAVLGTGVFYTVPSGRTLYITSAYLSMIPNPAAPTSMALATATEDTGALAELVIASAPAGATAPIFLRLDGHARRVEAGADVTITGAGALALSVGFQGWLY